jgi:hypothetical protein
VKEFYTEADVKGLGSNFLRESRRQEALEAYAFYLERFALHSAMLSLAANPALLAERTVRRLFGGELLAGVARRVPIPGLLVPLVKRYHTLEQRWQDKITESGARDAARGAQVFDDYASAHPGDAAFASWCAEQSETARKRCRRVFKALREKK